MLRGRRRLALVMLAVWCLLFLRCETTEKSIVRAVFLERAEQGWTAGLLYQAPEASADSSEATAEVRFAAAEGASMARALAAAERALPQQANYRLCDYLLLSSGARMNLGVLDEYEALILTQQCGRTAARVLLCEFSAENFSAASEEAEALPEALLQAVKDSAKAAPCLYDRAGGLVLPVLTLTGDGAARREEGSFLSASGALVLSAEQTKMACLLAGQGGAQTFWLDGQPVEVRQCVRSVTADWPDADSFTLRLDCRTGYGAPEPSGQQVEALAALCSKTVQDFWQRGVDLAGLRETAALRHGPGSAPSPAKNACPQLRTDVRFLTL